jgi:hypothetical protein
MAKKPNQERPSSHVPQAHFEGCPSYFRSWCRNAKDRTFRGGYRDVGAQLRGHLTALVPNSVEDDEWLDELKLFEEQVEEGKLSGKELEKWFRRVYPKMMALIPTRAHSAFVQGFLESLEEHEGLEW